ncbi:hypothetical protein D9546_07055 [Geobacillus stearothermophilus]|nr:hypothetical protein D9546_07055 [Geobacillus stearothermophilus]
MSLIISFASLVATVVVRYQKKSPLLGVGGGGAILPISRPLHFLRSLCVLVRALAVVNVLFFILCFYLINL